MTPAEEEALAEMDDRLARIEKALDRLLELDQGVGERVAWLEAQAETNDLLESRIDRLAAIAGRFARASENGAN